MANEVKDKFSTSAALTITLASLASSTVGVGRQSTEVDNTTTRYQDLLIYVKLTQGTSPTSSKSASVYLIRNDADGTPHRDDAAGASDAGVTVLNAQLVGTLVNKITGAATGDEMLGSFLVSRPGPKWAVAVVNSTGVALNSTGGNHWVRWIGCNPEVQ